MGNCENSHKRKKPTRASTKDSQRSHQVSVGKGDPVAATEEHTSSVAKADVLLQWTETLSGKKSAKLNDKSIEYWLRESLMSSNPPKSISSRT